MKKNNKYKKFNLSTLSIHAGQKKDKNYNSRAVPIYQTTSHLFENHDDGQCLTRHFSEDTVRRNKFPV